MNKYKTSDAYPDVATTNTFNDSNVVFRHQWDDPVWDNNIHLQYGDRVDLQLKEAPKQSMQLIDHEGMNIPVVAQTIANKPGSADPRFKRVLNVGVWDDVGSEMKKFKEPLPKITTNGGDNVPGAVPVSFVKNSKLPAILLTKNSQNPKTSQIASSLQSEPRSNEMHANPDRTNAEKSFKSATPQNLTATGQSALNQVDRVRGRDAQKTVAEKPSWEQRRWQNARKSLSDCTLQTKNTLGDEDGTEDLSARLHSFTSATRLSKVHRWMKEYKPTVEKRRSVITVIGQTQGKSLSTVLNEINQRRKLAKELDKHALCETILQSSEKERELKNLIAKVDLVSPDGKIVYSARKVYGYRETRKVETSKSAICADHLCNAEPIKMEGMQHKTNVHFPERDVTPNPARKRKCKRGNKKCESSRKSVIRDILQSTLGSLRNDVMVVAGILLFAVVLGVVFYIVNEKKVENILTIIRPKSKTWYDQLFR